MKIIKTFNKLGVEPDQHAALVGVGKAVHDPGFVQAALKLFKIQSGTHKSYEQIVSEYENINDQVPSMQQKLRSMQAMIKSLDDTSVKKKQDVASLEAHIGQLQKKAKSEKAKMEKELEAEMKQLQVNNAEPVLVLDSSSGLSTRGIITNSKFFCDFCDVGTRPV